MVLELAGILEQVDLRLAICSQANVNVLSKQAVRWNDSITKIPLGRGTGTHHRSSIRDHPGSLGRDVNHVNTREAVAE